MLSDFKTKVQTQFNKIYSLVEAQLSKLNLKMDLQNSLQFFLFLHALIALYCLSLTSNFELFVVPLLFFGYSTWEIWQNLQALKDKKSFQQNPLVFKTISFFYLFPCFCAISALFLIPVLTLIMSPIIPIWSWPIVVLYGAIFLLPSGLISIAVSGLVGLSLVIYWNKTKEMLEAKNLGSVEVEFIKKDQ